MALCPTEECHFLSRADVDSLVHADGFGRLLTNNARRAVLFDVAASFAKRTPKRSDVISHSWRLTDSLWTFFPVRDVDPAGCASMVLVDGVYDYSSLPEGAMVVDFANRHVGGGCFSRGFVQEEQMVAQSTDLAVRLHSHRPLLRDWEVISFSGIHFDAWWDGSVAMLREDMSPYAPLARPSAALVVLAADAPRIRSATCGLEEVQLLATKVLLLFYAAHAMGCPSLSSGLLGGGAYRGNRPLVLALHMAIGASIPVPLRFHLTVLRSFSRHPPPVLQMRIRMVAEAMLRRLSLSGVSTLDRAVALLSSTQLPNSHNDQDVADDVCRYWEVPLPSLPSPLPPLSSHSSTSEPLGEGVGPARCALSGCTRLASWMATGRGFEADGRGSMVCMLHFLEAVEHDRVSAAIRI